MSYVGNTPTQQAFTPAVDFFNGNGSTTAFTLSRPVASVAQVQAVISNVPQKPGDAFTVSGNTITFTSAPPSGTQNIYVYYTSPITQVIAPGQGTVGTAQLQDGAVITQDIANGAVTPAKLSTGAPAWDANGNMALNGATLSAWGGTSKVLQLPAGSLESRGSTITTAQNAYFNGTNWIYSSTAAATLLAQTGGAHYFYTAPSGTAGNAVSFTQALTLEHNKTLALQGASPQSGTGITFPATQSASTDANTLDDYEEGTWTPTISSGTFVARRPRYTKVGRLVTVSAYCDTFSDRSSVANLSIGGLPFTANSDIESVGSIFMRYSNNPVCAAYIGATSASVLFYGVPSGDFSPLLYSQLNNANAQIYFEVTYTTST